MKIKTQDLTGPALDWAVAKCEDNFHEYLEPTQPLRYANEDGGLTGWSPSTDWAQGGPIIEREQISLVAPHDEIKVWEAWHPTNACTESYGPTPLIAAMRCYSASKLGDEIEVPEEIK